MPPARKDSKNKNKDKEKFRRAISSNLLTGALVGSFVGAVVLALVWTSFLQVSPQGNQITFQETLLLGGSASTHSYTSPCSGYAQVEFSMQNPSMSPVTIESFTISGNGVQNATALVSLQNSCLTLSEASPSIPAGGDYVLEGYITAPIRYTSYYSYVITFSNGQTANGSLLAQS